MRVLIIDNYDSFTYNLYQYVGEILAKVLGEGQFMVKVFRNDEVTLDTVKAFNADRIIISPGPGTPSDKAYFGISQSVILECGKNTPLLGVCLGMQGIAYSFGGNIIRAAVPVHGKTSTILHDEKGVYRNTPQNLEIMRYHSLIVEAATLPKCFEVTSVTVPRPQNNEQAISEHASPSPEKTITSLLADRQEIMGIRHKEYPIEGIQYHPESFATEGGKHLLSNFLVP